MSKGNGKSFKRNDWLKLGVGVGLATTGLGAAGIGPLAGLFGSNAAGAGLGAAALGAAPGEAAGAFVGNASGLLGMGAGAAPGEAIGSINASMSSPGFNWANAAKSVHRGMNVMQQGQPQQQQITPMQRPQAQQFESLTSSLKTDVMPQPGTPEFDEWMKRNVYQFPRT